MTLEVSPDITPPSTRSPEPVRSIEGVRDAYRWAELGECALRDERTQAAADPPAPIRQNQQENAD